MHFGPFYDYAFHLADNCLALSGGEVEESESRLTALIAWLVRENEREKPALHDTV